MYAKKSAKYAMKKKSAKYAMEKKCAKYAMKRSRGGCLCSFVLRVVECVRSRGGRRSVAGAG
jgi:hypothetical protein